MIQHIPIHNQSVMNTQPLNYSQKQVWPQMHIFDIHVPGELVDSTFTRAQRKSELMRKDSHVYFRNKLVTIKALGFPWFCKTWTLCRIGRPAHSFAKLHNFWDVLQNVRAFIRLVNFWSCVNLGVSDYFLNSREPNAIFPNWETFLTFF